MNQPLIPAWAEIQPELGPKRRPMIAVASLRAKKDELISAIDNALINDIKHRDLAAAVLKIDGHVDAADAADMHRFASTMIADLSDLRSRLMDPADTSSFEMSYTLQKRVFLKAA
jgi:hypothetical protein